MLDAVGAPLTLRDLAEDGLALVQQLIDNAVLGVFLEVFECVLKKPPVSVKHLGES